MEARRIRFNPPSLSFFGAAPSGRVGADGRRWSSRPGERTQCGNLLPPLSLAKDGSGNAAPRPTIVSAPSSAKLGQNFSVTVGSQRSDHLCRPRSRWVQHPFIQSGAAADPCAVLSERNNNHRDVELASRSNPSRLLYAFCMEHKSSVPGGGENCLRSPKPSSNP